MLTIDDLGREYRQRDAQVATLAASTVEEVLRHRLAQAMPTFITSNLDPTKLATLYEPNVASLLTERSIVHRFVGQDYRTVHQANIRSEAIQGLIRPIVL